MKDLKFTIGFILVLLASIACAISALLWLVALPVFVIGLVLVLLSKKPLRTRVLAGFGPFVLIVGAALLVWNLNARTTPETYLIPSGFQGKFRVIYGEPCGVQPHEEDGRRILVIPPDGLLIIASEFEAGIIDHKYFFVDAAGNRQLISTADPDGVTLESTGSFGGEMPDGSFSSESENAIEFADFFVGNPAAITVPAKSDLDSLTMAAVEACRRK